MSDKNQGIYKKYEVTRTDGSSAPGGKHEKCEYFVLDLTHDKCAIHALEAYATACEAEYPELANDLKAKVTTMRARIEMISRGDDGASEAEEEAAVREIMEDAREADRNIGWRNLQ